MKIFIKFLTIIYLLLFFNTHSIANDKTAFIDLDYLVQNSNIGKKTLDNINEINKKNIKLLDERNKILKKLETEIKNKKNVISEQDFQNEVKIFQKKLQEFTNEKNNIVNEFNQLRKNQLEKVFKALNPVISAYMKENSINILLDSKNIFMGNPDINLTNDILKKINDEIR